jgi:O-antigen/teichoic acid export membrane protein
VNTKNILAFAFGPIASAAFGLITIPVVAWAFSAEDVGRLNVIQVTVSFCLLLFVLGLDQTYVREFHEAPDRAQLLKACFAPGFLLLVAGGVFSTFFSGKLSQLLYGMPNPVFFWITLASVVAAYISRFLSLILRMQERGLAFSMSQVIPKAILLVIIGSIAHFGLRRDFLSLQLAFLTSSFAVLAVYSWNTRSQWRPALTTRLDRKQTQSLLQYGAPLIFSGLAYWGLVGTSTVALRTLSNFSELGIYSVTTSIAGGVAIFQSIFTVVWAPIVFKWVAEEVDLSRVDRVARRALAAVCATFVACGMLSWLADFLLPPQYAAVKYLLLCAIVQPLLYTLSEITYIGVHITRRTMLTVWVTVAALCVNVILSISLVPSYGAAGAVVANAVAFFVFFAARTEVSAAVWRQFPRLRIYTFTGSAVAFSVATVALGPLMPFSYTLAWFALAPVVGWCFRTELAELLAAGRNLWSERAKMKRME